MELGRKSSNIVSDNHPRPVEPKPPSPRAVSLNASTSPKPQNPKPQNPNPKPQTPLRSKKVGTFFKCTNYENPYIINFKVR